MTPFTLVHPTIPEPICSRARIPYSQRKAQQQALDHLIAQLQNGCFQILSESTTWRMATALLYTQALKHPHLYHPVDVDDTQVSRSLLGTLLHKFAEEQSCEQDAEAILELWSAFSKHLSTQKTAAVGNRLLSRIVELVSEEKMDVEMWLTVVNDMLQQQNLASLNQALLRKEVSWAIEHPKLNLNLPICIGLQLRRAATFALDGLTPKHLIDGGTAEASTLINARLNYHGALGYQNCCAEGPYGYERADILLSDSTPKRINKAAAEYLAALDPAVVEAWQSSSYAEQNTVATQLSAICAEAAHHHKLPYLFFDGMLDNSDSSLPGRSITESLTQEREMCTETGQTAEAQAKAYRQWLFPCGDAKSNKIELTEEARCIWYTLCGICSIHIQKNAAPWTQQFKEGLKQLKDCIRLKALQEESSNIEPDIFKDLKDVCHQYSVEQTTEAERYLAQFSPELVCIHSTTEHTSSSTSADACLDIFFQPSHENSDLQLTQNPYNLSSSACL